MAATLYDLLWVYPLPPAQLPNPVEYTKANPIGERRNGIPAVILYPALLTPEIMAGDDKLELILLTKPYDKPRWEDVNQQLKIIRGLDPNRSFSTKPLFENVQLHGFIKIDGYTTIDKLGKLCDMPGSVSQNNTAEISTHRRFRGILDKRAIKLYKDKGLTWVSIIEIDKGAFKAAHTPGGEHKLTKIGKKGNRINCIMPKKCSGYNQDYIVSEALKNADVYCDGVCGFEVGDNDVNHASVDQKNPVLAYHPVFCYDRLDYAGLGFMGDTHLSSRQQLLTKSKARVIEHREKVKGNPGGESAFMTIGDMVNVCSENTKSILDALGTAPDVDLVLVLGDVVDHIRNVFSADFMLDLSVKDVWKAVGLDGKWEKNYQDNVDYLAFFSLVTNFYKSGNAKPVFVVAGNHDCYRRPYGISPRVLGVRANEGIPADHNLTFYEAALAFGPTWDKLVKVGALFEAEHFRTFFTMFTPWADCVVQLPKQKLVVLAWGDDEDIIDPHVWGQPTAHLGWANYAVSNTQLSLLRSCWQPKNDGRKIILSTHFTFVSYRDHITEEKAWDAKWDDGDVYYTRAWYSTRDHSDCDWGTFEANREAMYADVIAGEPRKLQCILTGHSHRRGFYTVRGIDTSGNNSVKTGFYDYPLFYMPGPSYQRLTTPKGMPDVAQPDIGKPAVNWARDQKEPWIVVCDSGGSIPRHNRYGEFHGWGSDQPSGGVVAFDDQGRVKAVDAFKVAVRGVEKPRFVVALDYMDILAEEVIDEFQTDLFTNWSEMKKGWKYQFNLKLDDEFYGKEGVQKYRIYIESIHMYYHPRANGKWSKIAMEKIGDSKWEIPEKDNKLVGRDIRRHQGRGLFLSIAFNTTHPELKKRYDFSTPWTFEVALVSGKAMFNRIMIVRKSEWRECPDFERRKKYDRYD